MTAYHSRRSREGSTEQERHEAVCEPDIVSTTIPNIDDSVRWSRVRPRPVEGPRDATDPEEMTS
jgi:hypothetical protein